MSAKDPHKFPIKLAGQWLAVVLLCLSASLLASILIGKSHQLLGLFYQISPSTSETSSIKQPTRNDEPLSQWPHHYAFGSLIGLISALIALGLLQQRQSRRLTHIRRNLTLLQQEQAIEHSKSRVADEFTSIELQLSELSDSLTQKRQVLDRYHREIEMASLRDPLTGLANRTLFLYELERLQLNESDSTTHNGVILLLDLNDFKRINDGLGHHIGDTILRTVAERLELINAERGTLARLGGDEFALLLPNLSDHSALEHLCQRINKQLSQPIPSETGQLQVSASLGLSYLSDQYRAQDAIRRAEIAMYKAKEAGDGQFCVFDESMASDLNAQLLLEEEIRQAFILQEFTLFLQPKVNMSEQVIGFEALIRWDHPERGIISPGEFIPVMETMGVITDMDRLVLDASCRQLSVWEALYPEIQLAVNISSQHLCEPIFLTFLEDCLKKYHIHPARLELEITESMLMDNISRANKALHNIKKLGVSIAIDDFGTGYSSLSYLKNLPIDTLKIDQEFIKDIPDSNKDMQISTVIIFLAKQLGYKVVAEGVETVEQFVFLKTNQCDLAQGYYFDKPMPAHKATLALEYQHQQNIAPARAEHFPFPNSQLD